MFVSPLCFLLLCQRGTSCAIRRTSRYEFFSAFFSLFCYVILFLFLSCTNFLFLLCSFLFVPSAFHCSPLQIGATKHVHLLNKDVALFRAKGEKKSQLEGTGSRAMTMYSNAKGRKRRIV